MWTTAVLFLAFLQIFAPKRQNVFRRLQLAMVAPRHRH
jgi:hypothetical protein